MSQTIKLKRNKTNAATTPSTLLEGEIAVNILDKSLFVGDGSNVVRLYVGSDKYFNSDGYANNALKLGGNEVSYFGTATQVTAINKSIESINNTKVTGIKMNNGLPMLPVNGVVDLGTILTEHQDLSGYQTKITSTNKLAYSLISGTPTTLAGYGITDKVAYRETWNNFIHNNNEFTFVAPAYSSYIWFNYRTASGGLDGAITEYRFAKGAGLSYADIRAAKYIVNGGTSSQFLKADGSLDSTSYLPLSGGTIRGSVIISGNANTNVPLNIATPSMGYTGYIRFGAGSDTNELGHLGFSAKGVPAMSYEGTTNTLIHSGNIGDYKAGDSAKLGGYAASAYPTFENQGTVIGFNLHADYLALGQGDGHIEFYDNGWYNSMWGKVTAIRGFYGNLYVADSSAKYDAVTLYTSYGLYIGSGTSGTYNTLLWGKNINLVTGTNGQTRLYVTNGGNVLIGTTTDNGAKLQVSGNISASGYQLPTSAPSNPASGGYYLYVGTLGAGATIS